MARLTMMLADLLSTQHDVVGRWQLTLRQRRAASEAVRRGEWKAPTHQTFFAGRGELSAEQKMWAALLHGGPGAKLAGRTALVLHGWSSPLDSPYHAVTRSTVTRTKTPSWIRLHRSTVLVPPSNQHPPRVDVHTATVQAASWAKTDREAMFIVLSVLQQRLSHPGRLRLVVPHNCKRRQIVLTVIHEFTQGITSINEHDFARLCRKYGLPEPARQVKHCDRRGRVRSIDVEFRTHSGRVVRVEIEGMQHLDPFEYLRDIDRHNDLVIEGAAYLRVLSYSVRFEADRLMPQLRDILEHFDATAA